MKYILYRKNISLKSGTGQLIKMQSDYLRRKKISFSIMCKTGFFTTLIKLKTIPRKPLMNDNNEIKNKKNGDYIIDHSFSIKNSDITFIHNIPNKETKDDYIKWLKESNCHIISNSQFTKSKLIDYGFKEKLISVCYPGFNEKNFNVELSKKSKESARIKLGIPYKNKTIGFITSGDFEKRGLKRFLDICEELSKERNDLSFFIMGAKQLPQEYNNHPIVTSGKLIYKPKNTTPGYWLSAIDIFVYPALFEEFGMVIPEALAMHIPVLTTRDVGASEILPEKYQEWLLDEYNLSGFCYNIHKLLDDPESYKLLVDLSEDALLYNKENYSKRTIDLITEIITKGKE